MFYVCPDVFLVLIQRTSPNDFSSVKLECLAYISSFCPMLLAHTSSTYLRSSYSWEPEAEHS